MNPFSSLGLGQEIVSALTEQGYENPTPIQAAAIPKALAGHDLLAAAQTGTGKTAAFMLPSLERLKRFATASTSPAMHPVRMLVLTPTRELADQIDQNVQAYIKNLPLRHTVLFGGVNMGKQTADLRAGCEIVVATVGRLLDHVKQKNINFSKVEIVVLDEADRMLDMGFFDDIMTIIKQLPAERQTVLFSATMPPEIAKMAREVMRDPVEIKIAVSKPAEKIDQSIYICRDNDKTPILKHIFSEGKPERVIVFISSKQRVKELNVILKRRGFNCAAMHSDLEQSERDEVMLGFKQRKIDILIATDIVSRGIDIDDIQMVINYDAPRDPEDYVHRIGRTARAGRAGRAITLIGEKDRLSLNKIERLLETKIPRNPLPEGCKAPEPADDKARGRGQHSGKSNRRDNKGQKSNGKNNRRQSNSGGERGKSTHSSATGATSNEKSAGSPASKRRGGQRRAPRKDNPQTEA